MAAKSSAKKYKKVVVHALTDGARKEGYAICGGGVGGAKKIPFEKEVHLTDNEIAALKRQREAIKTQRNTSVDEISEKYQIPKSRAYEMLQKNGASETIKFTPKYLIEMR